MAKITLPRSSEEILELAICVLQKHESELPHEAFNHIDMQILKQMVDEAKIKCVKLNELKTEYNQLNHELQLMLGNHRSHGKITPGTVRFILAQIKDVFKGMYRQDLSVMIEWGFRVETKKT